MKRNDISTARFEIFDDVNKAQKYVQSFDYNVVVKADGLAARKDVTALGDSLESAISNAYYAAEKISWASKYCRTDIRKKGLNFF